MFSTQFTIKACNLGFDYPHTFYVDIPSDKGTPVNMTFLLSQRLTNWTV